VLLRQQTQCSDRGENLRLMKNSKILFTSPNIYYTLSENWRIHDPDPGNIKDTIEIGTGNEIPLYLSGFLC
jgi:hypothetical protein